MSRKVLFALLGCAALAVAAVGLGMYVYPQRPWLVWAALFFCWLCYRLKMRADALFTARDHARQAAEERRASVTANGESAA